MKHIEEIKVGDYLRTSQVQATVKVVTEKAVLLVVDNCSFIHKSYMDLWIPKSLLEVWSSPAYENGGEAHTQFECKDLPEWFCRKNKLI